MKAIVLLTAFSLCLGSVGLLWSLQDQRDKTVGGLLELKQRLDVERQKLEKQLEEQEGSGSHGLLQLERSLSALQEPSDEAELKAQFP